MYDGRGDQSVFTSGSRSKESSVHDCGQCRSRRDISEAPSWQEGLQRVMWSSTDPSVREWLRISSSVFNHVCQRSMGVFDKSRRKFHASTWKWRTVTDVTKISTSILRRFRVLLRFDSTTCRRKVRDSRSLCPSSSANGTNSFVLS